MEKTFTSHENLLGFYIKAKHPDDIVMAIDLGMVNSLGAGIMDYVETVAELVSESDFHNAMQADILLLKLDSMDAVQKALEDLNGHEYVATVWNKAEPESNEQILCHVPGTPW